MRSRRQPRWYGHRRGDRGTARPTARPRRRRARPARGRPGRDRGRGGRCRRPRRPPAPPRAPGGPLTRALVRSRACLLLGVGEAFDLGGTAGDVGVARDALAVLLADRSPAGPEDRAGVTGVHVGECGHAIGAAALPIELLTEGG